MEYFTAKSPCKIILEFESSPTIGLTEYEIFIIQKPKRRSDCEIRSSKNRQSYFTHFEKLSNLSWHLKIARTGTSSVDSEKIHPYIIRSLKSNKNH